MENPIKMDDLGVPLFLETPSCLMLDTSTSRCLTWRWVDFDHSEPRTEFTIAPLPSGCFYELYVEVGQIRAAWQGIGDGTHEVFIEIHTFF